MSEGAQMDVRGSAGALASGTPCHLILRGDSPHVRQILTGFYELAAQGVVKLRVTADAPGERSEWQDPLSLRADIVGRHVIYDLSDGWYIPLEVRPYLPLADHYFKRALDPARLGGLLDDIDTRPLGLNYLVTSKRNLWHRGIRPFDARRMAKAQARRLTRVTSRFGTKDARDLPVTAFEIPPTPHDPPGILFMTRAWTTGDVDEADYLRTDRETVNELRAQCIRAARSEFGERFWGGFSHDDFSRREYGDCLLPERRATDRYDLIDRMRRTSICVSTNGLHDSIPWKMAVYVAASRAVVTEKLRYLVPGGFAEERNYLQFDSVETFVGALDRLMNDADLRSAIMHANQAYYRTWVRPDAQVLRTLEHVLGVSTTGDGDA